MVDLQRIEWKAVDLGFVNVDPNLSCLTSDPNPNLSAIFHW